MHKCIMRRKPFITQANRLKRLQWAKENTQTSWQNIILTDESSIELGDFLHHQYTSRRAGEAYNVKHIANTFRNQRKTVMVWSAAAHDQKWPLYRVEKEKVKEGKSGRGGMTGVR
jgi:hypothetical protein